MVCNNNRYHSENTILGISHVVNSKDDVEFAMLFTALGFAFSYDPTGRENRRTQILPCSRRGGTVVKYSFTLDA